LLEVKQAKVHSGEKKNPGQNQKSVLPGRADAKMNYEYAGERKTEEGGDQRFVVKLRAAAQPGESRYKRKRQKNFRGAGEKHFLDAAVVLAGELPRRCGDILLFLCHHKLEVATAISGRDVPNPRINCMTQRNAPAGTSARTAARVAVGTTSSVATRKTGK
jgi:hypothetical protein